jgi:hypothetical protein
MIARMSKSKPQIMNWMICDAVHIDPATGKQYILGVFSHLRGRAFPIQHPKMVFFFTVKNLTVGKHSLKLSCGLTKETKQQLVEREFETQNPNQRVNLINEIQGMGFAAPGEYSIFIDIDGEEAYVADLPVLSVEAK